MLGQCCEEGTLETQRCNVSTVPTTLIEASERQRCFLVECLQLLGTSTCFLILQPIPLTFKSNNTFLIYPQALGSAVFRNHIYIGAKETSSRIKGEMDFYDNSNIYYFQRISPCLPSIPFCLHLLIFTLSLCLHT